MKPRRYNQDTDTISPAYTLPGRASREHRVNAEKERFMAKVIPDKFTMGLSGIKSLLFVYCDMTILRGL
jgi:hypothetical protein